MATKHIAGLSCVVFFLSMFCLPLGADDKQPVPANPDTPGAASEQLLELDFWFDEIDGDTIFTQLLRWDSVDYCPWYDVTVQQFKAEFGWETVFETRVERSELEVQLPAGEYRYKVVVFNLLEKPAVQTEWFPFVVIQARQPRLASVSPGSVYFEEENTGVFSIRGRNILADSLVRFRSIEPPGYSYDGSIRSVDNRERDAEVFFSIDDIEVGLYEVYLENPGGLSDAAGSVKFAFIKPMDFDVSVGYMPLFVLWDDTIEKYFGSAFVPLGVVVKATFIPVKRKFGYFGVGLYTAGSMLSKDTQYYTLSMKWLMTHCVFVYQKTIIKQRLILDFHAGPGMTMFQDLSFKLSNGYTTPDYSPWSLSALAGASAHIYVRKRMYIDVSVDCSMAFMKDMRAFSLHPSVSAGWQF